MDNKTFENVVPRRNESDRGNSFRMLPHTLEEKTALNHPPPSNCAFIASFAPVRHNLQPIRHNLPQIPTRASNPRTAVSKASLREPYPSQSYPHQKHELLIVPEIESMQDVQQWREEPAMLERKSFYPIAENLTLEPSKGFVKEKNLGRGDFPGDSFPPGMHVGGILQDSMRIDTLESDPADIKCMEWKEKSAMWKESESNRDNQRFPSDPIKRKIRRDIQEMEGLPLSNAFSTSTIVQKMESLVEAMPPVLPVSAPSSQSSPQAYYFQGAAPSPPTPSFTQSGAVPSPSSRPKTGRAKTNAELKKQLMEKRAGQHLRGQGDGGSQASSPAPSHTEVPSPLSAPSPLSGPAEGSSPGVVDTDSSSNGLKRSQETKNLKIENIIEPTLDPGSAGASSKWVVGDMMWARVAGHPWWPCMVSPDPVSGQFTKHVPRGQKSQYHVQFFGDEGERSWVPESSVITYEGQPAFESFCKQMITEHKKDRKNYQVPASRKKPWDIAVRAADQAYKISRQERIKKMLAQQTSKQPKAGEPTITKAGKELEKSSSSMVVSDKVDKTSGINKRRHSKSQDLKHGKEEAPTDLSPLARKKSRSVEPVGTNASEESHIKFPKNVSNQVIAQFTVFCQKRRESVKLENPEFSDTEIESRLWEQWNELDDETKSRFIPMGSDFTHLSQMMLNVGVPQVASSVAKRSSRVVKPKKTSFPGKDESVKPKKTSALAKEETSKPKRTSEERENPKRTSLSPEEGGARNKKSSLPAEEAVRPKRTAVEEVEVKPKRSSLSAEESGVSPKKSCLPVEAVKEIAIESESVSQDSKEVSKPPGMSKTKDSASTSSAGRGNAPSRAERRSKATTNDDKINGSSVQVPDKAVEVESKANASSSHMSSAPSLVSPPPSSSTAHPSDVPPKKRNKQVKMPDVEDMKERQASKDGEKKIKDNPKKSENAEKVPVIDDMEIFEEVCFLCEKADDQIIQCQGPCRGLFHRECLSLPSDIPEDDIVCSDCKSGTNKCFVCNKSSNKPILCSVTDCGRFYHKNCIQPTFFNPDNQKLICPLHSCMTCRVLNKVTENPTEVDLDDVDFYECIRCPTAFHMMGLCLAAGSKYLAGNFVICSRHFEPSKTNNLHSRFGATWCFTCQKAGGTLISCETCPAAYHANCLKLSPAPSGSWQCNRCSSGITPLPGDIVWVKFGSYRWWPAQIYFPYEAPKNIRDLPHQIGEFPVCFYGSRDYLWLHQGRVFPFKEGDKCCKEATAKGAGKVFDKAMEESIAAYRKLIGENADPMKSCSTTEKPSKGGANRTKVGKSPKPKVEVKKEKKDNVTESKQERRSAQTRKEKSLEGDEIDNSETRSKRSSDAHKVKSREVEKEKLVAQRLSEKNQTNLDSKKSGKEETNEKNNDTNGRSASAKKDKLSHVRRSSTASKTRLSLERVRKRHSVKSEPVPFLYKQIGLVTAAPGFHENVCFWCNQSGGRLLNCDKVKCPKTYHVECLQMTKLPHGPWLCPWHHCTICGKASIYQCNQCPNAFCQDHFTKGITYAIDGSLICAAHPEAEFDEDEEEAAPVDQETKDGSIVDPVEKSSLPVESSGSPEKLKCKPSLATKLKSRATYKAAAVDREDSDSGASDGRLTIVEDAAVKPGKNEKSAKRKRTEKSPKKQEKSPRRTEKSPRRMEKSQKQDQNCSTRAEDVPTLPKSPDSVTKSVLPSGKVSPMFDNSDDEFPELVIDVPTI